MCSGLIFVDAGIGQPSDASKIMELGFDGVLLNSSVARSLNKRNNLDIEKGLALWEVYSKRALDFCQTINVPVFYCSFEYLLESPEKACSPLFKFLNRELD